MPTKTVFILRYPQAEYLEKRMADCGVSLNSYGQREVDGAFKIIIDIINYFI